MSTLRANIIDSAVSTEFKDTVTVKPLLIETGPVESPLVPDGMVTSSAIVARFVFMTP